MKKLILSLLLVLLAPKVQAQVLLTATTEILELQTSSTASTDYVISYADHTSTTFTPGSTQGNITTATTTTILSAPAASTQRQVKNLTVRNKGTASQNVILKKDVSGTEYFITGSVTLNPNETLILDAEGNYSVRLPSGAVKNVATDSNGYNGINFPFYKPSLTTEAAGVVYLWLKDAGLPGAWVPGTPGLNGDALSCNTTADAAIAGAYYLQDPATGSYYLTQAGFGSTSAGMIKLYDLIWYNTGLVVTTTTAQSITLPTLPNRDLYGSNNGDGWNAGIYVTTATTNAGAITDTTLSYTDSDGNAGNTATMASFPATAVAGTFIPFLLAAGDRGIQDIASITLGTSYAGGAISLILYRDLASIPQPVSNTGGALLPLVNTNPGVRLYNGTCLIPGVSPTITVSGAMLGNVSIIER